jgi:hypothetical protein
MLLMIRRDEDALRDPEIDSVAALQKNTLKPLQTPANGVDRAIRQGGAN